jgi:hypothetical protein
MYIFVVWRALAEAMGSVCRYSDGHMDVTRLSASKEFADGTELAVAAAAAGAAGDSSAADIDARAIEGGRCAVISRTR